VAPDWAELAVMLPDWLQAEAVRAAGGSG